MSLVMVVRDSINKINNKLKESKRVFSVGQNIVLTSAAVGLTQKESRGRDWMV